MKSKCKQCGTEFQYFAHSCFYCGSRDIISEFDIENAPEPTQEDVQEESETGED